MICVPEGFAHGFQTLTPDAEMLGGLYLAPYSAAWRGGLRWDDARVAVELAAWRNGGWRGTPPFPVWMH
ncbi:MAG: dTDP-4-dehydrorhamnose 3,5-epimerase family protein [Paracoccaceae bacterium]